MTGAAATMNGVDSVALIGLLVVGHAIFLGLLAFRSVLARFGS